MTKLKLAITVACVIFTHKSNASVRSECEQQYLGNPAHIVTWDWIDRIYFQNVTVATNMGWTGRTVGSASLTTFHSTYGGFVAHYLVNPTALNRYDILGASAMFGYSPLFGVRVDGDFCSGVQ